MKIIATRNYERRASRLFSAKERMASEAEIVAQPDAWPVIPGTGGARKARVGMRGHGKRGGGRVIYFYSQSPSLIALLDIYAKSAKENLTYADQQNIRAAIQEIREALRPDGAG
jgi:hypothetical protein